MDAHAQTLDHIMRVRRLGYAIFDGQYALLDHNFRHTAFRRATDVKRGDNLWQIFPELVGSEGIIAAILAGKKRGFKLEMLNQTEPSGKLRYYDLSFFDFRTSEAPTRRLFCLIEDVTQRAGSEQEIRQQQYEILLLQARLLGSNQFLADTLLGNSGRIQEVRKFISKVAGYNTSILLQGESGSGKSLVARLIHRSSQNPKGPFVEINCAAIPAPLLESELFGYEKGAFTNALSSKKGLLEEADGGTLFLDEIGELPLSLQAKLLNFLETRRFRRLGSTKEHSVNLRLIAATNKDLKQAVANSEFRDDLYFRINVVSITLPPVRDLGDDIIMLAWHFISVLQIDLKKHIRRLTAAARQKLLAYHWPGNVRELRNVIERAMIFAEGEVIDADDLVLSETTSRRKRPAIPEEGMSLQQLEREYLIESLRKTGGNQSKSAELLDMSLDTFRYRLKKFSISPREFR